MVFLDHVQNLHIHAEKTHKDSGAHCMNMLILYMVQKTHTGPYYRVLALFMCGVKVMYMYIIACQMPEEDLRKSSSARDVLATLRLRVHAFIIHP